MKQVKDLLKRLLEVEDGHLDWLICHQNYPKRKIEEFRKRKKVIAEAIALINRL